MPPSAAIIALTLLPLAACAVVETAADVTGTAVSTAADVAGTAIETTADVATAPLRSDEDPE